MPFRNLRYRWWLLLALSFGTLLAAFLLPWRFHRDRPPDHVILIGIDTLRADHLSCYGYEIDTSPRLDEFAAGAVLFEKSMSQSPWTLPSFASIFTSLYHDQHRTGIHCIRDDRTPMLNTTILEDSFNTLPEVLKSHGYKTAAFTEGALMSPFFGFGQGFDLFKICSVPEDKTDELNPRQILFKDIKNIVDESIDWIDKNREDKFFVFLHSYETHRPYRDPMGVAWKVRKKYVETGLLEKAKQNYESDQASFFSVYDRLILYDSEIMYTDYHIGRLFDALKEMGLYDESLIIFTSDHGEEFGEHGNFYHGKALYRESVFVPLIVKLPHQRNGYREDGWTAEGIDILPTVLDLCEIEDHDFPLVGKSLFSEPSEDVSRAHLFVEDKNLSAVVKDGRKLIFDYDAPEESVLFDLETDPLEKNDVLRVGGGESGLRELIEPAEMPRVAEGRCAGSMDEETRVKLRALGYIE
jgi:arylsulfatase A-like enzyme